MEETGACYAGNKELNQWQFQVLDCSSGILYSTARAA